MMRRSVRRTVRALVVLLMTAAAGAVAAPGAAAQTGEITIRSDIRYAAPGGTALRLDAYLPPGRGPHPALLVIPGGRWVEGSKEEATWLPTDLAALGFAAFVPNHRPATEAPFPAALEDVQAAVRFVRGNAERFDIDPTRIGAIGASAGGHLAALLATSGEGPTDVGARVAAAVSWSGPMDLTNLLRNDRPDLVEVVRTFLGCARGASCVAQARAASPITHVDPTDGAIYLGNSTEEIIPLDQATRMIAALERNDVPTQLVETQGRNHGFGAVHNEKFFTPAAAFLGNWLGVEGASAIPPSPVGAGKDGATLSAAPPPASGGKQAEAPSQRAIIEGTPAWLIVVAVAAAVAGLGSLIVTVSLLRRLRSVSSLLGSRGDRPGAVGDPAEDTTLVGSRADPPL